MDAFEAGPPAHLAQAAFLGGPKKNLELTHIWRSHPYYFSGRPTRSSSSLFGLPDHFTIFPQKIQTLPVIFLFFYFEHFDIFAQAPEIPYINLGELYFLGAASLSVSRFKSWPGKLASDEIVFHAVFSDSQPGAPTKFFLGIIELSLLRCSTMKRWLRKPWLLRTVF
jgi:hypothetical protein